MIENLLALLLGLICVWVLSEIASNIMDSITHRRRMSEITKHTAKITELLNEEVEKHQELEREVKAPIRITRNTH